MAGKWLSAHVGLSEAREGLDYARKTESEFGRGRVKLRERESW
jgi:hypothetical protein